MKVYYAHCIGLYDTFQEIRDINTLLGLKLEIVNPNNPETDKKYKELLKSVNTNEGYNQVFDSIFNSKIDICDVFAFRSLPDGRISAGVARELKYAKETGKIIIELPSNIISRSITKEETKEYLKEIGYR